MSQYELEKTTRINDQYPYPGLRIHAISPCGKSFRDIGFILEPSGPNPLLCLPKPQGILGLPVILAKLQEFRKTYQD